MPYLSKPIINFDNELYEIIDSVNQHMFHNKNGTVNQKVLGLYVHEVNGDRVLAKENKFLICKKIEEAQIIE